MDTYPRDTYPKNTRTNEFDRESFFITLAPLYT